MNTPLRRSGMARILNVARCFWAFLLRDGDEMLKTNYVKKSTAFKIVYDEYESYTAIL